MISFNDDLVKYLQTSGALKTDRIIKSFKAVDRSDFVPNSLQSVAFADQALPIGWGQTISQPATVAFMLELLQPNLGDKVLEIGFGSGYVAALLSQIVGKTGLVVAVERIAELGQQAYKNLTKYNFPQLRLVIANASKGIKQPTAYDKIIISAAASKMPAEVISQLTEGGKMVFPYGQDLQEIILLEKVDNKIIKQSYPGFVFVPLVD
ncbi:MAG: Protein-L-isoaspartate(D-aspartate) O-methyltransferase [Parcubacteria group bacterium GW2011_GWA1_43_27]|uniref:Protein-L-isoaspartate O-methyltransferase n=1 Tax=Candidatus Veblenbacteria bacterium RIFOXYC1_FULL_42_9 TaxID=1802427 RepID=A0A1G2Q3G6_9BACT|nr:MAG: Protein-L-isoaspartate(D-aspartate) O-methyltransferase [Parcubacteria group bacterium GW2011_GWA1_43_27]KKT26466.1 MAG: Protein-L-isoaspartate(D-aspartate) O-methyltransferase [Parcubacteria group bacterium GW2011_GWF1_43_9]OHA55116.1 MAG: protein-L-isoaspartate O-methyltransferase [Candidatus Veblenbacteria bacterium RIFOXYC1_FULL_42_9]HBZ36267.1 protein-L-isoaspartate O-methyltransferase [Candidatus Veblenbacteria bacterium]